MAREVCVVVVHGINTDKHGYSDDYERLVRQALGDAAQHVTFREVFWAEEIRDRQTDYLHRAEAAGLRPSKYRKLAVQALGDAAAYQKTRRLKNSSYYYVQGCVIEKLRGLERPGPARPIIFVGHSLGCHVISSFAWDVHKIKRMTDQEIAAERDEDWKKMAEEVRAGSELVRLDTLAGLITLGNNMPLFTFTFGPDRVFPITKTPSDPPAFPGPLLPPVLSRKARWVNIFSPNDLLGYPLKCLNDSYRDEERLQDIPINVESIFSLPYFKYFDAHVKYWTNKRVVQESAKLIREVIEADEAPVAPAAAAVAG